MHKVRKVTAPRVSKPTFSFAPHPQADNALFNLTRAHLIEELVKRGAEGGEEAVAEIVDIALLDAPDRATLRARLKKGLVNGGYFSFTSDVPLRLDDILKACRYPHTGVFDNADDAEMPRSQPQDKPAPAPTIGQTYGPLQALFDHLNRELFGGRLPHCLITLQRRARSKGYFARERFAAIGGEARTDEIAMNPAHFRINPARDTASTLLHEMVHLWQYHFGSPKKSGYHDREWAAKMVALELMPSTTGAPGGKLTGHKVDHYVLDGEAFDLSWRRFEATGQAIGWGDAAQQGAEQKTKQTRVKFKCSVCGDAVWGKPSISALCIPCDVPFIPVSTAAKQRVETDPESQSTHRRSTVAA
jgi:hypothetical protein